MAPFIARLIAAGAVSEAWRGGGGTERRTGAKQKSSDSVTPAGAPTDPESTPTRRAQLADTAGHLLAK